MHQNLIESRSGHSPRTVGNFSSKTKSNSDLVTASPSYFVIFEPGVKASWPLEVRPVSVTM